MISIIVARDVDGGVGKENDIPWMGLFPEDMRFFRQTTNNNTVIMGTNTWLSLPSTHRPLPNRTNIVVSSLQKEIHSKAHSVIIPCENKTIKEQIISLDKNSTCDIYIIGGPTLWSSVLDIVDRIYITNIPNRYNCDVFFNPDLTIFKHTETISLKDNHALDVYVYERNHKQCYNIL